MSRTPPIRTCVGCREQTTKSNLVRVVADEPARSLTVDQAARRPGRGAHLHPSAACLELAERRRAFPRALRLEGPLDISAVRSWIEAHAQHPTALGPTTGQKRSSSS